MEYITKGALKLINDTQTFQSGFSKREFVITTDDKYPQDIKLEVVKDNCDKMDSHKIGDKLEVSFNVRGNEHEGRYYVNLQAWKIISLETSTQPLAPPNAMSDNLDQQDDIHF